MLSFLSNVIESFTLSRRIRLAEQKLHLEGLETYFNRFIRNNDKYVDTDTKPISEIQLGGQVTSVTNKRPSNVTLRQAVEESRRICRTTAHGKNILTQIVNYTVGKGFSVTFKARNWTNVWRQFAEEIKWGRFRRELIRRIARDGEAIIYRKNRTTFRFIEPNRMPGDGYTGEWKEGVVWNKQDEDVEEILGYIIDGEEVSTEDIYIFKDPFRDANELRGWPIMYDAQPYIKNYEEWVDNRALLNKFRSSIMLLREHKNSSTDQIRNFQSAIKSGAFKQGTKEKPFAYYGPGAILDTNSELSYKFLDPQIGAQEVVDDGRAIRLLIACFFSFAEYMVTCDASNANLASTAVAEAPSIKALESWQEFYQEELYYFIKWAIGYTGFRDEVFFTFPSPVVRDELKLARAKTLRYQHGAISRKTWMESENLNSDEELERVQKEELPPIIVQAKMNKDKGGQEDKTLPRGG